MRQTAIKRPPGLKRAAVLAHYEKVALGLGLNPPHLLKQVGLSPQMIAAPNHMIPMDSSVALLDLTAQASACDTVGLLMAEARTMADFGPISLLLMQQPTMRSVLHTVLQYRHMLNESLGLFIEDAGVNTLIHEEIVTNYCGNTCQSRDLAVGVLMVLFRSILGKQWRPQQAHFTRAAPQSLALHKRIFGCPLVFEGEFNGVMCLSADLDKPHAQADATLADYARSFIDVLPRPDDHAIAHDVRRAIYPLLPIGRATIEQVASSFGINVRTLQRRLDDADVHFTDILNDVRRELAQRYVQNTSYPMGRIASLLGYANLSSFTRWFTAQFHCSPSAMRA